MTEIGLFVTFALLFVWFEGFITGRILRVLPLFAAVGVWLYSAQENGWPGWQLENLWPALGVYGFFGLVIVGLAAKIYDRDSGDFDADPIKDSLVKLSWAMVQQAILVGFLLPELQLHVSATATVIWCGVIFMIFHLPNPWLSGLTLIGGLGTAWISLYWPNILAAGIMHAVVSYALSNSLPEELTGGFRVGPGYIRWLRERRS